MSENGLPRVMTPQELAEYLKVDETVVLHEFEIGSLQGFKVADQWRCSEAALFTYMNRGKSRSPDTESAEPMDIGEIKGATGFSEIEGFDFDWPGKRGENVEHYDKGYETTREIGGKRFVFRIGFCQRRAAGRLRPRIVVWIDNRAIVEFAGGNDFEKDGMLAGIIKTRGGKQVAPNQKIPTEYAGFNIRRYDSIVQGPWASRNLGVAVHKDDFESMIRHAVIRARWKEII